MSDRIRRPTPERTSPLRSWSNVFERALGGAPADAAGDDAPGAVLGGDVVSRSVDLGYRVIDEYIRQGQRMARGFSERSAGGNAGVSDLQDVTLRMSRYASEFMGMWFELVQMAAQGAGSAGNPAKTPASQPPAAAASPAPAAERVTLRVASVQPVEVSLDIAPEAATRPVIVHSLRAVQADKPRLEDVALEPANGGPPVLRLRVPPDQPEGIYSGVIVDEASSRPVGTLSVRVLAE